VVASRSRWCEGVQHGEAAISVWRYVTISQFWFEPMQNWQSEFIAVAAIGSLSIFLRQNGSAESKPVAEPTDIPARDRAIILRDGQKSSVGLCRDGQFWFTSLDGWFLDLATQFLGSGYACTQSLRE
jgi:hypothetical protein